MLEKNQLQRKHQLLARLFWFTFTASAVLLVLIFFVMLAQSNSGVITGLSLISPDDPDRLVLWRRLMAGSGLAFFLLSLAINSRRKKLRRHLARFK